MEIWSNFVTTHFYNAFLLWNESGQEEVQECRLMNQKADLTPNVADFWIQVNCPLLLNRKFFNSYAGVLQTIFFHQLLLMHGHDKHQ